MRGEPAWAVCRSAELAPGVASHLQLDLQPDKTPLGGVLSDNRFGWLSLGSKLCVIDLKTGQKVAAWTFGAVLSLQTEITCVSELLTPLAGNTRQLLVSLQCENIGGVICVFHCNGSQILRCIQTEAVVTQITTFDSVQNGPLSCFDGVVVAGTKHGELLVYDLNRAGLIQALKDSSQGYEHLIKNEQNMANLAFLSLDDISVVEEQREIAIETDDHLTINLNDQSNLNGEYLFRNPDGTVRMRAKRGHVSVTTVLYVPQLGSVVVGYNFGGFQIWNLLTMCLEYTSSVNVDCLPVTHFGFQEPCDDPRAFCYLWVTYSAKERFVEEEFPLAVMYSLTYQGKRILSETQCLYQEFTSCTTRFQIELTCCEATGLSGHLVGGRTIACHTYSVPTNHHSDGDESVLNICQLVWECWTDKENTPVHYGMVLFDLDQWYKDQMPETQRLQNNAFMCAVSCDVACEGGPSVLSDVRLLTTSITPYMHVQRLEEHFYPNSLQYSCICLTNADTTMLSTTGVQRQLISSMDEVGPTVLLNPAKLYEQCVAVGLTPLYIDTYHSNPDVTEQRKFLLSVALEARLSHFLKKCARDWATGSHSGAGCTLQLFVEWSWQRALVLKKNGRELTTPLFDHSGVTLDRNVCRCLEHCVRQLTQLASLLDSVVTKCCNLVVPDALSDMEERCKAINMVAVYFQVVQWFLKVGLLPEYTPAEQEPHMLDSTDRLPYPVDDFRQLYQKRRIKLRCLEGLSADENAGNKSCPLLYIDQLIEHECGGELIHKLWQADGSECGGVYPPPSLHGLLRIYLLGDVSEEHKHSIVLYLLLDYSVTFREPRYEAVIRRLMQFPTMFGLSNTAIKATQAFWHLDHRDFDFALDQLQCLTGNTLSDWQHSVVLSALLAQKKTQAALQYLHVRKPAPIQGLLKQNTSQSDFQIRSRVNDHGKLEDWQSCCDLYLARQLVFEAMDVIRLCAQNAYSREEKAGIFNFFFSGCKRTGLLSKILQISLLPLEEEVFIKFLQSSGERQCEDILLMYYLQRARYLEAQRYKGSLRQSKLRPNELSGSTESLLEPCAGRNAVSDGLVDVVCESLPRITDKIARITTASHDNIPQILTAKPMSVFVQAKSPKNTFMYKSTFIQNSIDNASETWVQKPRLMQGLKRALEIEETPFICTPRLARKSHSIFLSDSSDMSIDGLSPPKRARFDTSASTPRTPKNAPSAVRISAQLGREMDTLLEMPAVQMSPWRLHADRSERSVREATPHSILKVRTCHTDRETTSPVDSQYLADTDEELETGSQHSHHTHVSDTAKHLRFEIPSSTSLTPSPLAGRDAGIEEPVGRVTRTSGVEPSELGDQYNEIEVLDPIQADSGLKMDPNLLQSPKKKRASEENISRKTYKDNVKGRRSLSTSGNSSLNEDLHLQSSIESIADIPIMLINPHYAPDGSFRGGDIDNSMDGDAPCSSHITINDSTAASIAVDDEKEDCLISIRSTHTSTPQTPRSRPSIKIRNVVEESASRRVLRSRSRTPERPGFDSPGLEPIAASPPVQRSGSHSKTPDNKGRSPRGSPQLDTILEVHRLEQEQPSDSSKHILRTPEKTEHPGQEKSPVAIDVLRDNPQSTESHSPLRRSQRSRSRTPEVESTKIETLRNLRGKSETPEKNIKILSPKIMSVEKSTKKSKPLSRLVLEANTFSTKNTKTITIIRTDSPASANQSILEDQSESIIECTPIKFTKTGNKAMSEYLFSPIMDKSVLESQSDTSILKSTPETPNISDMDVLTQKTHTFTPINETMFDKSVLGGYRTSSDHSESNSPVEFNITKPDGQLETNSPYDLGDSVLKDYTMSVTASADNSAITDDLDNEDTEYQAKINQEINQSNKSSPKESIVEGTEGPSKNETEESTKNIEQEKQKIVEIEREINELEGISEDESENELENQDSDSGQESESPSVDEESQEESRSSDSGKDTEHLYDSEGSNVSENESDDSYSSDGAANNALCVGNDDSEVVLVDDSDEERSKSASSAKKKSSRSSGSSNSCALQIDLDEHKELTDEESKSRLSEDNDPIDIYDEKQFINMDTKTIESEQKPQESIVTDDQNKEIQQHIVSPNEFFTESVKDDNGMVDKAEHDPFLKPPSEISNPSDMDLQLMPKNLETEAGESSTLDVFNDGNYSLMTDDNSAYTDRSEVTEEVKSPVKVVVTDTEGKENVEIHSVDVVDNIAHIVPQFGDIEVENARESEPMETEPKNTINPLLKTEVCSLPQKESILAQEKPNQEEILTAKKTEDKNPQKLSEVKPASRKRTKSSTSNASKKSDNTEKTPETIIVESGPTTPSTSKRRRSVSSNQSEEKKTPSTVHSTPPPTPLRRSTRKRSTQSEDDNISIASVKSKASNVEDEESVKSAGSVRKSRKSMLLTKPELSVIPELEDTGSSRIEDATQMMLEYSSSRRLTRHQKSLLERSMEPPRVGARVARRPSAASSTASVAGSEPSLDVDDDSNKSELFLVESIDPISLLNKKDFEGPPDLDEQLSVTSDDGKDSLDFTKQTRIRMTRAVSETGSIKELRKTRRMSMDLEIAQNTPERMMSPASVGGSPGRPRRSSFNKAVEALHTPKRTRRLSSDPKEGETDSMPGSPQPHSSKDADVTVTPARRTRRNSSMSDSTPKSPARRTRRTPSVMSVDEQPELPLKKK